MAQFTNQAQLSYNNSLTNSNVAYGEVLDVLSATTTAVMNTYVRNDDVTYVISIVNSGIPPFTDLVITDNLGAFDWGGTPLCPLEYVPNSVRYYVNGELQAAPPVDAQPTTLEFSSISVPAHGNAILIYEEKINQFAPLGVGENITTETVVSGGGLTTPLTMQETISTEDNQELTITKAINPVPVIENGEVTYSFVIQNAGNSEATDLAQVTITDVFTPILSNVVAEFNGVPWVEGTDYSYNSSTGLFTSVPGHILVPAATFTRDASVGSCIINPGVSVLIVKGNI